MSRADLLLFCAYLVVLVTLLGQGLTLAPLLRRLRLAGADVSEAVTRNEARSAAVTAALARLDELQLAEPGLADVITPLRRTMQTPLQRYSTRLALLAADPRLLAQRHGPDSVLTGRAATLLTTRRAGDVAGP